MCEATPPRSRELPKSARAPGLAREFLIDYLCRSHALELADEAALLTTEAVTNAVRYAGPPIELTVNCSGSWIEVRVHDASSTEPRQVDAEDFATSGRGVALIEAVSDSWGVLQYDGDGKDVWFRLIA